MNPHVKEHMGCSSDKAIEVDRPERISYLVGEDPEEHMDADDGLLEPSLHSINNQA